MFEKLLKIYVVDFKSITAHRNFEMWMVTTTSYIPLHNNKRTRWRLATLGVDVLQGMWRISEAFLTDTRWQWLQYSHEAFGNASYWGMLRSWIPYGIK